MARKVTLQQAETARGRAVRAAENLLDDPDRADDFAGMDAREYAVSKGWDIVENPRAGAQKGAKTMATLKEKVKELQDELEGKDSYIEELESQLDAITEIVSPSDDDDSESDDEEDD